VREVPGRRDTIVVLTVIKWKAKAIPRVQNSSRDASFSPSLAEPGCTTISARQRQVSAASHRIRGPFAGAAETSDQKALGLLIYLAAMGSWLAGSALLIGFLLSLGLTQEIAQREGQVGQDPDQ
jgi:hypothetical protein